MKKFIIILMMFFGFSGCAYAEQVNIEKLADAIYYAEGGAKTKHPYGILKKYKKTSPRQACINTIKTNLKVYLVVKPKEDFIVFLSKKYAPIGAKNDPTNLNKNWVKNVKYYYNKGGSNVKTR